MSGDSCEIGSGHHGAYVLNYKEADRGMSAVLCDQFTDRAHNTLAGFLDRFAA